MIKRYIKRLFYRIITGVIRVKPTDADWDYILRIAIEHSNIIEVSSCLVRFDCGLDVWASNKYYAYASAYTGYYEDVIPFADTMIELNKKIREFELKKTLKGITEKDY